MASVIAAVQKPIRTQIDTSPGPAEGKSTVAVNLAAIIALSGRRVALVDADLRRPMVHKQLGLPNRDGLSSLFRGHEGAQTVSRSKLELPNLMVITSGSLPPNPSELLGSERMSQILEELAGQVDVVILDTPPSLVGDAQILSARVDAVLLVVQPGRTPAETARACLELFRHAGARVIGAVLNRIPRNREHTFLFGLAYVDLSADLKVTSELGTLKAGRDADWIDPTIGLQYDREFAGNWRFTLRGDIGGFGVGSDFMYHLLAAVGWQPSESVTVFGGYRLISFHYE